MKELEWKRTRFVGDLQREEILLEHAKVIFEIQKQEFVKFLAHSSSYATAGEFTLAFGELLRKLWSYGRTPVAPRAFKGKHGTMQANGIIPRRLVAPLRQASRSSSLNKDCTVEAKKTQDEIPLSHRLMECISQPKNIGSDTVEAQEDDASIPPSEYDSTSVSMLYWLKGRRRSILLLIALPGLGAVRWRLSLLLAKP